MPSPFPGMDPYLERPHLWRGFHTALLVAVRAALTPQLGAGYYAEVEEALYLEGADPRRLFGVADVTVSRRPRQPAAGGAVAEAAVPVPGVLPVAVPRRWLTVRAADNGRVVTVIEVLSPSNKAAGADRDRYLRKRERLLGSRAHLVEIDLLRAGERMPVAGLPACAYSALVSRARRRPGVDLYPVPLRGPLPVVPVPLRQRDPEAAVDLKAALDRVYDDAGYARRLYRTPPDPPLAPDDAAWAAGVLAAHAQ